MLFATVAFLLIFTLRIGSVEIKDDDAQLKKLNLSEKQVESKLKVRLASSKIRKTVNKYGVEAVLNKSAKYELEDKIESTTKKTKKGGNRGRTKRSVVYVNARRNRNVTDIMVSLRSVNVKLNWTNPLENANDSRAFFVLSLHDDFKNVAHAHVTSTKKDTSYTIPGLKQDHVYKGSIKLQPHDGGSAGDKIIANWREEFELSTPFVVQERDLGALYETKKLLEKLEKEDDCVRIKSLDINLLLPRPLKPYYNVDVFSYHRYGGNVTLLHKDQSMRTSTNSGLLMIADRKPHELLKIVVKNVTEKGEEVSLNVFTGGLYRLGVTNLSMLLEDHHYHKHVIMAHKQHGDRNYSESNIHADYREDVKSAPCYTDDEVFDGYPCRSSDICIPNSWVCDGEADCEGRDDERDCDYSNSGYDEEYHFRGSCRKYEFRCRSRGRSICLPNSWLCDGREDCTDGWDEEEENCYRSYNSARPGYTTFREYYGGDECRRNEFRCWKSRDCISLRHMCDGHDDCSDGSDERVCENWSEHCDLSFEFRCYKFSWSSDSFFSRKCIPKTWVCDDHDDCPEGEDESYRMCRNYHKFSLSSLLAPFGIDFEINAGIGKKGSQ